MPYKAPLTFREIVPYLGIGLGVLIIVAFLIYYFVKRKKNEPVFVRKPKPKEPPHIIAYRELDRLKKEKFWQKNLIKKYHSEVTEVVRTYIEDRFYIRAMEQTSNEILASFKQTQFIDSILFDALKKMLQLADMVKFAKAIPLADENEQSLKEAYMFIDKTKQVFKSPEEENVEVQEKHEESSEVKALSENNTQKVIDS